MHPPAGGGRNCPARRGGGQLKVTGGRRPLGPDYVGRQGVGDNVRLEQTEGSVGSTLHKYVCSNLH